jgi:hypothetical protein
MGRIRKHLTYANVMATIAVFLVLSGGTAVALSGSNTVFSDDITDNEVRTADVRNDTFTGGGLVTADVRNDNQTSPAGGLAAPDLRPNAVGTSEVANGTLNDEDVGQGTFVNFSATLGTVAAHDCKYDFITGINAQGDHLLLTPNVDTVPADLDFSVQYRGDAESAALVACNPTGSSISVPVGSKFNLLVIDAQ